MKKVLITGGAGFIGSHLADRLIQDNHRVLVVDDLSKGKLGNINKKADFEKLDITSPKLGKLIKIFKPEIIFHFAAQSSIIKSLENPQEDIKINLLATQKLLEACLKSNVKKIVFASSAAIYKPTESLPIEEDAPKEPISFYGVSKLCSEYLLANYYRMYRLPYVSLRFANVYGERQDTSAEGGVVAIFITNVLEDRTTMINGDGRQTRDFIYISDVVESCLKALKDNVLGEFNVATAVETSINDLYGKILKIAHAMENKRYCPHPHLEVQRSALSFSKFNKLTGWKSRVGLGEGLIRTFNYFKNLR